MKRGLSIYPTRLNLCTYNVFPVLLHFIYLNNYIYSFVFGLVNLQKNGNVNVTLTMNIMTNRQTKIPRFSHLVYYHHSIDLQKSLVQVQKRTLYLYVAFYKSTVTVVVGCHLLRDMTNI